MPCLNRMSSHTFILNARGFIVVNFNEIKTRNDLAIFLDIPLKKLTYILYVKKPSNYYNSFTINKKNGAARTINAPTGDLKQIQIKFAQSLYEFKKSINEQSKIKTNISHGFEKNKNILTNAKNHVNKKFIINIDLEDFFDSFHFGRVRGYFEKNKHINLPVEVATIIAQLTCYEGKLAQGAPTSPIITNMICEILDQRLIHLAKEFKLYYTRYADDLTFSTNDKMILDKYDLFLNRIKSEIIKFGLSINNKKTRLTYNSSRQEVTGLIVNKKINIEKEYYKKTRAMADNLYKYGEFTVKEERGTIKQLEGRFSFINQIDKFNNTHNKEKKTNNKDKIKFWELNAREKEYQKFLFYKYFYLSQRPMIVTEGKTDSIYIKAALKNLYKEYPKLIEKKEGKFSFKISFFKRTNRMKYFFNIHHNGADTLINIYNFYTGSNNFPNYYEYLKAKNGEINQNPIFILFDNEQNKNGKPLQKIKQNIGIKDKIVGSRQIEGNLYILTNPLVKGLAECEIEDLFDDAVLNVELNNKLFSREDKFDNKEFFGKKFFADYINRNYRKINFDSFRPLLDEMCKRID